MVKKNYDDMLSRFHLVPERNGRTDGQTDGQRDRYAISISRVSMLTRDKNGSRDHDHAPRSVAISGRLQRISVARREIGFLSDVVTIADTQQVRLLGLSTAAFNTAASTTTAASAKSTSSELPDTYISVFYCKYSSVSCHFRVLD